MITYHVSCFECSGEYGIDAIEDGRVVKSTAEISESREDMQRLADMCNKLKLELCHLDDVVEDYLTDFCI